MVASRGCAAQILGSEDSRARYNAKGKAGIDEAQMVYPGLLFTLMFGGEQFEPFIGQLAVATIAAFAMDPTGGSNVRASDLER